MPNAAAVVVVGETDIERSSHLDSEMVAVSILDRMQLGGLRVPKSRFLRASRKSDHLAADWAVVQ